ncbi:uncharacterized protein LOC106180094 [Lingula anatina]|uniref:Uncharacterized protein LOC106180094 n=1 Tax=Lingula anatina TaxID=7574 RepID=A0A1S3K9Y5_LINAN|nr:uncharacterized protein LOC106180094 [Lingula anatina]|eukprot:XP_013419440.1 uncharacterized protein LOC106180094 [Lingula anatina]
MVCTKHCCYGTCRNDSRYPNRPEMEGVFFINFPKPKTQREKCEKWIYACGRPKDQFNVEKITKSTYICSKHFVGGRGPTEDYPDPIPATASAERVRKISRPRRKPPVARQNRLQAAEALLQLGEFSSCTEEGVGTHEREDSSYADQDKIQAAEALVQLNELSDTLVDHAEATHDEGDNLNERPKMASVGVQTEAACQCHLTKNTEADEKAVTDAASQTAYDKMYLQSKVENMLLKNQLKTLSTPITPPGSTSKEKPSLSFASVKDNPKQMKFFTGLTLVHFMSLFNFLGPAVNNLKYWNLSHRPCKSLKPIDELFIMLVRLRRGYGFFMLSFLFNLSITSVRCIFTTWLQFLYFHFTDLKADMFPDRSTLGKFMPKSFKGFKNVRCSVDCTEFFVQMPRNFARQGNLFSNYKNHHTFKCLIAVAPNGACVYISELYEGAISDREIFSKCGILDYLEPGDILLVDRGFTVEDLLLSRQVSLNIPPFLKGREKLTPQEELLCKKLSKARIHVERYNERLKKFKLIAGTMPLNMTELASQAVFVAGCLVNFQDPLAK